MAKQEIKNRNELKKRVRAMIAEEKTREDIFLSLKGKYRSDHALAVMVGEHPELHLKKKFRPLSVVLGVLLVLTAGGLFFLALGGQPPENGEALFNASLIPLLAVPVAIWIFQFIPFAMRLTYYLGYIALLLDFYYVSGSAPVGSVPPEISIMGWSVALLSALTIALASHLKKKLTPGYGIMGPKQDSEGNYLFHG